MAANAQPVVLVAETQGQALWGVWGFLGLVFVFGTGMVAGPVPECVKTRLKRLLRNVQLSLLHF